MGKPYTKEMELLPKVYNWSLTTPIKELSLFVKKSGNFPLYILGSGGSFSATVFTSLLHQHIGSIAKCLTPLEFLDYENIDEQCSILIISASGNNKDILHAFEKAVRIKPRNLGILCTSFNNKLVQKASKIHNVHIHATDIPTKKDGFLATNTLIATLIWICRAYIDNFSLPYVIPKFYDLIFDDKIEEMIKNFDEKEILVLMYDTWGKTAAIDAESKLAESGLMAAQITDYRNFAHGRHNWLDKNKEKTSLLALVTPHCDNLATKTIKLIPPYISPIIFKTNFDGPIASLVLLIKILYFVNYLGCVKKIDPGKPRIATFGRKIYHLSIPKKYYIVMNDFEKLALRRKFGHISSDNKKLKTQLNHLRIFKKKLSNIKFGSIIFDYDGTLCNTENRFNGLSKNIGDLLTTLLKNEIHIGIATGRGKSVRNELQKIIPKSYWKKILICYYNGSEIGRLNENFIPDKNINDKKEISKILSILKNVTYLPKNTILEKRSHQISIQLLENEVSKIFPDVEKTLCDFKTIKIFKSQNSIDVVHKSSSKLNLLRVIKSSMSPTLSVLCIGDQGEFHGNDYELLNSEFSLSVDKVSDDMNSCWNLLPINVIGEKGVLSYLENLKIMHNFFTLNIES